MTTLDERIEGERRRAKHVIARLRASIDAAEIAIESDYPVTETADALTLTVSSFATAVARLDAFRLAKEPAR